MLRGRAVLTLFAHDRCLAGGLWDKYFAGDVFSRESGEALRRDLLEPGGAEAPEALISRLLGPGALDNVHGGFAPAASLVEAFMREKLTM